MADSAGTKLPMWDMITIIVVCLMKVDLPPIFGPVINSNFLFSCKLMELGMKVSICVSTIGWRPFLICSSVLSLNLGGKDLREGIISRVLIIHLFLPNLRLFFST